jgi:hypothetical protein
MAVRGEKLGGTRGLVSRQTGDVVGDSFFSGAVESVQLCEVSVKSCNLRGLPVGSIHRAYIDWRGKCTCCVDQVFPCRVYIDSNHHDSRI